MKKEKKPKKTQKSASEEKEKKSKECKEAVNEEEEIDLVEYTNEGSKNKKFRIPKFWMILIVEFIYVLATEVIFKVLLHTMNIDWTLLRIILSSMILVLIVNTLTINLPNKLRKTIHIIFSFLVALYAWLQLGFINFLGAFMSLGNAEQGTKITNYVFEFVHSYPILYYVVLIPFILLILYYIFEKKILKEEYTKKLNFKDWRVSLSLVLSIAILCGLYYGTLTISFMQNKYQSTSNKALFKYPSNPTVSIKNFGSTMYFILDIKGTIFGGEAEEYTYGNSGDSEQEIDENRTIDDTAWEKLIEEEKNSSYATLNNYFINRSITPTNDKTGMLEGKNLIFIMMESIGGAVFDEAYSEYFPTLYKVYNEGIKGVNNYSPRNNCATGESEMTSQISLYSIETTCTVNTYKKNKYPQAIMSKLRESGYHTSAYHDYDDQYYSRSVYENNLGSTNYYSAQGLGMELNPLYKEWPSDLDFMQAAVPKFINEDKFAAYMVTVSAHMPYMFTSKIGNKHLDLFKDTNYSMSVKRYLSKVKEFDLALEYLLEALESSGKLEDTVIVLFGDHYPYGLSDKDYASIAKYDIETNHEVDRTPFIIYNSELPSEEITKYISPLDYTPTLLNLFGIDYDPRYYMGNDVYSDYEDYVVFPDNSWQSEEGYYSASKGEFIPIGSAMISDEKIMQINKEITDMRNISSLAIKKDYFKYLYSYFDKYEKEQESLQSSSIESEE